MTSEPSENYEGEKVRVDDRTVTVGKKIDSGSEGTVYKIRGNQSSVLKLFHGSHRSRKADKIRAMVKKKYQPTDPTSDQGFQSIIWPQEIVKDPDTGSILGYKMHKKDLDEWKNALVYSITELTEENSNQEDRLRPAFNMAYMINNIHEEGHAVGDFNHENFFIKDGYISLIDCDAFHIRTNDNVYEGVTFLPRYSPPEKRPDNLEDVREADRFCLGVHVFQFLMGGHHPYHAQGPDATGGDWGQKISENSFPYTDSDSDIEPPEGMQKRYDRLPEDIRRLFEDCFDTAARELKWGRPSIEQWTTTLGLELDVEESKLPSNSDPEPDSSDENWDIFGDSEGRAKDDSGVGEEVSDDDTEEMDSSDESWDVFGDSERRAKDDSGVGEEASDDDTEEMDSSDESWDVFDGSD